jgi:hypothetical protein
MNHKKTTSEDCYLLYKSSSPLKLCFLVIIFSLLLTNCSTLPGMSKIENIHEQEKITTSFKNIINNQQCPEKLDSEIHIDFRSFFYDFSMDGFCQLMLPSDLRLIALNPLGQPFAILTIDNHDFSYLAIPDKTLYKGSVDNKTFSKYAPTGLSTEDYFFWLSGQIPDKIEIDSVYEASDKSGFWLKLINNEVQDLILLDPELRVIKKRVLFDNDNTELIRMEYLSYLPLKKESDSCLLPQKTHLIISEHNAETYFTFSNWIQEPALNKNDFHIEKPPHFKLINLESSL